MGESSAVSKDYICAKHLNFLSVLTENETETIFKFYLDRGKAEVGKHHVGIVYSDINSRHSIDY